MSIQGKSVELASTKVVDGILTTKEFGELEFVVFGPGEGWGEGSGKWEVRATRSQIETIRTWLDSR